MRTALSIAPGLNGDDTSFGAKGRWRSGSLVRFHEGRPQVDGGFESLVSTLLTGVCRAVFPWTDNAAVLNIGFGTHSKLELWQGGALYDITPFGAPDRLGANPLGTTNTSARVDVTHVAHGYTTGQLIKVFGAAAVGGITPNIASVAITVDTVDTYHYTFTSNATSTTTGGGANVVITPLSELPAGAIDGTGSAGYGTGAYGTGPYGITPASTVYYPRTWSFGAWGQKLLASPRGGGLYEWSNVAATRAVAVEGAPTEITYMLVAPMDGGYQAFALGTEEEVSGTFNPMCIRHSSIRNNTVWSTTASGSTAREYILTGGGRIVAGRMCGRYILVWTNDALFLGTFVGSLNQPWRFDRVTKGAGLAGPNAVVVDGQRAFWVGPDQQFYTYALGGQPEPMDCPIWQEFNENLAAAQADKIVASMTGKFNEVRWDYPDRREGYENSRFVRVCVKGADAGAWSQGVQARTAFVGEGPTAYPIGTTYEGNIYYHERGRSADGGSFAWHIETADQLLSPEWRMLVRGVWPDFSDQMGPVQVTLTSRETPQGGETITTSLPMAPGDAKADLLASGRLYRVRFSGESAPTSCRIGEPVFDVERAGKL
jgi:hypothetical protein